MAAATIAMTATRAISIIEMIVRVIEAALDIRGREKMEAAHPQAMDPNRTTPNKDATTNKA